MTNIEIQVNGAVAVRKCQKGLLTAGMVGATVGFSFDSLWDGLSKTAVFKCGGMVRDVIGVEDTARIPAEVLCADTELYVGVEGRSGDGLWKCRQAHTAQAGWEPGDAASLWERVCESHSGTLEDPVPYDAGMALEDGKYYHQDYVIYRCFRDTGNPVYQALAELVDLYVEIV